jgi:hypothetical protein
MLLPLLIYPTSMLVLEGHFLKLGVAEQVL